MNAIIKQIGKKSKFFIGKIVDFLKRDVVFYALLIIFSSSISFLLGSLSEFQKIREVELKKIELQKVESENKIYYTASKKGKKYYLP
jgi:hypothetical protein